MYMDDVRTVSTGTNSQNSQQHLSVRRTSSEERKSPMLEISGVRRLTHTGSLHIDSLHKYGVVATDNKLLEEVRFLHAVTIHAPLIFSSRLFDRSRLLSDCCLTVAQKSSDYCRATVV